METTPLHLPNIFVQKKGGSLTKWEKSHYSTVGNLQRRLISAARALEVHGVACFAQRRRLVTRAIGATRFSASKTLASKLLIRLLDLRKAINGPGAAADELTCVQRPTDVRMSVKRNIQVSTKPLLLLG